MTTSSFPAVNTARTDAALTNEQVDELWIDEPLRAYIEWTYRMDETPAIQADSAAFAVGMLKKIRSDGRIPSLLRLVIEVDTRLLAAGELGSAAFPLAIRGNLRKAHNGTQKDFFVLTMAKDTLPAV